MKLKDKFEILSTLSHDLVSHDLLYDSLKFQNFVPTKSYSSRWYFNGCWSLSCERATSKTFRSLNKIRQQDTSRKSSRGESSPIKAPQIGIFNEALSLIPEGGNPPPFSASPEDLFADGEKNLERGDSFAGKNCEKEKNKDIDSIESLAIALYHTQNDEILSQLLTADNQKCSSFLKTFIKHPLPPFPKLSGSLRKT